MVGKRVRLNEFVGPERLVNQTGEIVEVRHGYFCVKMDELEDSREVYIHTYRYQFEEVE